MSSTSHAYSPVFTLSPANQTPFSAIAQQVLESHDQPNAGVSHTLQAYAMGCTEGELAYAVAAQAHMDDPSAVVGRCKEMILLTLGLCGNELSIHQQRQRGFVIGLMTTMADAIDLHMQQCDAWQRESGSALPRQEVP